jgi:hypothetical protein
MTLVHHMKSDELARMYLFSTETLMYNLSAAHTRKRRLMIVLTNNLQIQYPRELCVLRYSRKVIVVGELSRCVNIVFHRLGTPWTVLLRPAVPIVWFDPTVDRPSSFPDGPDPTHPLAFVSREDVQQQSSAKIRASDCCKNRRSHPPGMNTLGRRTTFFGASGPLAIPPATISIPVLRWPIAVRKSFKQLLTFNLSDHA